MKVKRAHTRKAAAQKGSGIQYAALPFRGCGEAIEILLITSRQTRRWIIPKGWPMAGRRPSACAAREALEEAGVSGEIEKKPFGHYRYFKRFETGTFAFCKVDVFALKVVRERKVWAEKGERKRRWFTVEEAAAIVDEPQLQPVILEFGAQMAALRHRKSA